MWFIYLVRWIISHIEYNDDPSTKYKYTEQSPEELISYLNKLMEDANTKTKQECPLTNFVFCLLTGLDLVINIKDPNPQHQEAVDRAVIEKKHNTLRINKMDNVPAPWTSA